MAKMTEKEQKELWIRFACATLQGFEMQADEVEDHDEHANDMIMVATKVADGMLDEYEERFAGGQPRKKQKTESEPPPESDDDLEDDDDDEDAAE